MNIVNKSSIKFIIPSIPPSVNAIYDINFRQRLVYMKKDVAMWKTDAKNFIPKIKAADGVEFISISATFFYDFFFKNGKMRRFDTHNLIKVLIDAIAEKNGFDDKIVKFGAWWSIHETEKERVEIELFQIGERNETNPSD